MAIKYPDTEGNRKLGRAGKVVGKLGKGRKPAAPRIGRPPLPEGEKLVNLTVRVTQALLEAVQRKAAGDGKPAGVWVRHVLERKLR